ncbi:hypothetical protein J4Q44_G00380060 [Coregonus suidteri]|uniref:Uncharacterized protein n=1 Tax=Coregonus suidteri TaxID=861788 RepID=A0AAN8QA75_9TELE
MVTHRDHVQKIHREAVGWCPCAATLTGFDDSESCTCALYYDMWDMDVRHSHVRDHLLTYYRTYRQMPCDISSVCSGVHMTDLSDEEQTLLMKTVAWIFQGFSVGPKQHAMMGIRSSLGIPCDFTKTQNIVPQVYKLTDCQNETRAEMFNCQQAEEQMTSIHLSRKWLSWVSSIVLD